MTRDRSLERRVPLATPRVPSDPLLVAFCLCHARCNITNSIVRTRCLIFLSIASRRRVASPRRSLSPPLEVPRAPPSSRVRDDRRVRAASRGFDLRRPSRAHVGDVFAYTYINPAIATTRKIGDPCDANIAASGNASLSSSLRKFLLNLPTTSNAAPPTPTRTTPVTSASSASAIHARRRNQRGIVNASRNAPPGFHHGGVHIASR
eukprot:31412-Pelagococcus_subviridis.AAC.13